MNTTTYVQNFLDLANQRQQVQNFLDPALPKRGILLGFRGTQSKHSTTTHYTMQHQPLFRYHVHNWVAWHLQFSAQNLFTNRNLAWRTIETDEFWKPLLAMKEFQVFKDQWKQIFNEEFDKAVDLYVDTVEMSGQLKKDHSLTLQEKLQRVKKRGIKRKREVTDDLSPVSDILEDDLWTQLGGDEPFDWDMEPQAPTPMSIEEQRAYNDWQPYAMEEDGLMVQNDGPEIQNRIGKQHTAADNM